jgi:hypothetical protein
MMYLRAGLLDLKDGPGVLAAIANDADLTEIQKQTLTQIYETFRRENARGADATAPPPAATATSRRASRSTSAAAAASSAPTKAGAGKTAPTRTEPTTSVPQKIDSSTANNVATATEKE